MTNLVYVHTLDEVMTLNKVINLTMETHEVEREVAVELVKEALIEGNRGIHPCVQFQGRVFIAVPLDAILPVVMRMPDVVSTQADDISEEVKIRRLNEIIEVQNLLSAEANKRCIGKVYEVLVEGTSKRSREQLVGRTEQNRVVVFDRGSHRVGDFVTVRITEASSATLKGELV